MMAAPLGQSIAHVLMAIIFFMIGVSFTIALGFLVALLWSMKTGQHDDLYTPALRILLDDDAPATSQPAPPTTNATTR